MKRLCVSKTMKEKLYLITLYILLKNLNRTGFFFKLIFLFEDMNFYQIKRGKIEEKREKRTC